MSVVRMLTVMGLCALPLTAQTMSLLYDARELSQAPALKRLDAAARNRVLSAIFRKYLTRQGDCQDRPVDPAALKNARDTGQIVPEVGAGVKGSFTMARSAQTAYLIQVGECGAWTRGYFGTYRLAIFSGTQLVTSIETPGEAVAATADVDADGIDEILISGCGVGQGVFECGAHLISVARGQLHVVQEFPSIYEDACGATPERAVQAAVVFYQPGRTPRFSQQTYEAPCPASGRKPNFRRREVKGPIRKGPGFRS